jgi:hypothetical protein
MRKSFSCAQHDSLGADLGVVLFNTMTTNGRAVGKNQSIALPSNFPQTLRKKRGARNVFRINDIAQGLAADGGRNFRKAVASLVMFSHYKQSAYQRRMKAETGCHMWGAKPQKLQGSKAITSPR